MQRILLVVLAVLTIEMTMARPVAAAPTRWDWPLAPKPIVSRGFDPPSSRYGVGHRGVDLVGSTGQSVLAAGSGVIGYVGVIAGRGVVTVLHAGGLRTTYEPVTASLPAGAAVGVGQVIGVLAAGHLGCPTAACLHWGLKRGEIYLNPLSLLKARKVRLLPKLVGPQPSSALRRGDALVGRSSAAAQPRRVYRSASSPTRRGRASPGPTEGLLRPRADGLLLNDVVHAARCQSRR